MAIRWSDYRLRQDRLLQEIMNGQCTLSCAAAIHTTGPCHCRCRGFNHGALWIEDIVVMHVLDED